MLEWSIKLLASEPSLYVVWRCVTSISIPHKQSMLFCITSLLEHSDSQPKEKIPKITFWFNLRWLWKFKNFTEIWFFESIFSSHKQELLKYFFKFFFFLLLPTLIKYWQYQRVSYNRFLGHWQARNIAFPDLGA